MAIRLRPMRTLSVAAMWLVPLVPVVLRTQSPIPGLVGERVRLTSTADSGRRIEGRLTTVTADSLIVTTDRGTHRVVPIASVTGVEYAASRTSRSRHLISSTATGFILGTVAGGFIGHIVHRRVNNEPTSIYGASFGALAGAGGGFLLGARRPVYEWERVELDSRVGIIVPMSRSRRIGLSLAF